MATRIRRSPDIDALSDISYTDPPERLWVYDGAEYLLYQDVASSTLAGPTSSLEVVRRPLVEAVAEHPVVRVPEGATSTGKQAATDEWQRQHGRVFRYWITCPDTRLPAVRSFVRASQADTLPTDWTEEAATDAEGTAYTVCTYTATMDQARALGAEQRAISGLADIPGDVSFFQAVAQIDGFSGITKVSRQPSQIAEATYAPGELFQTNQTDAGDDRGTAWSEGEVLSVTGLTLS